jgi:hypothetical protein
MMWDAVQEVIFWLVFGLVMLSTCAGGMILMILLTEANQPENLDKPWWRVVLDSKSHRFF